uniref:Ribonuclease H-like domain-containing protein n=1 Tax=Tanacetum cinerariifolium TaxID=118510 RepID=A0A6L2NTZ9_TANCI|nr:ribonuclease H-like domain-containing protein [Tanacetum cinerariifolium]
MRKRRNDVKERTTLLLTLADEHQLRFSKYKTAQGLWAAIRKTFGGNEATKKTKKNQLKQQYGKFKAEGKEMLGKEKVNTASFSTASTQVSPASAGVATASFSHDTILEKDWEKISIQGTDVAGFDKSKVECFNCHKMGHFARECRAPRSQDKGRRENFKQSSKIEEQAHKALMAIDGVGWNWRYMANEEENHALVADEEAITEFALMAKSSPKNEVLDNSLCSKACKKNTDSLNTKITELSEKLSDSKTMLYHYKLGLLQVEVRLVEFKNQEIKFCEKIRGLEFKVESKDNRIERLTKELEELKKEKEGLDSKLTGLPEFADDTITDYSRPSPSIEIETVRKPSVKYPEMYRNTPKSPKFDHLAYDCAVWEEQGKTWPKNNNTHKSISPRNVFHKTGRTPMRTNRSNMNAAQPKRTSFSKPAHSYVKRPFQRTSAVRTQFRVPRVSTGNTKFPTVNKNFPTGNSKLSTADVGDKGKADNSQNIIDDKGYWDSGCSRHMTGNISYLSDYEPYDGGYVSFGQGGGKITSKGIIKTGRDSKLRDDTNVLLRTPRQHNMYSIDLNNNVYHKDLTCLVVKASAEESVLWHRRLEIENLKDLKVKIIRCDNRGEFRNKEMNDFCSRKRIKREFKNTRTPQRNGVAERRNKTLIEAAKTMLADAKFLVTFWAEAINTACYVQNRVLVNKSQNKTPYESFNGRTPAIGFLKPFGCHVMILNTLDNLGKFDAKGDEGYFICNAQDACNDDAPESNGNSNPTATSKNLLADHMETLTAESLIPTISSLVPTACLDDSPEPSSDTRLILKRVTSQDDTPSLDNILTFSNRFEDIFRVTTNTDDTNGVEVDLGNMENNISASHTPTFRIHKDHPKSQIIDPVDTPDLEFPARVYQVEKAMYELHQAPRAWHQVTPKECHLHAVKRIFRYLKGHPKLRLWYPKESPFDLVAYSDSDYGGATQDQKSTTGGCQFLCRRLISWQCKKQTIMATSTIKAEYVVAASGCG